MTKLISLIKSCNSDNMKIFKVKNNNKILPILLFIIIFGSIFTYANAFLDGLSKVHSEITLLVLFALVTTLLTLVQGIYKAGTLLFNCKDDDLLLSLPIKRETVVFVRIFKFYIYEVLYNSLFLVPAMLAYSLRVNVGVSYYFVSIIALLILPIFPIVISTLLGAVITGVSSKFKFKNIVQIIVTMAFLIVVFYFSSNFNNLINGVSNNAGTINSITYKFYYPIELYSELITNFSILGLLKFIFIHVSVYAILIFIISRVYFKINTNMKSIKTKKVSKKEYQIRKTNVMTALIKKEFNKFISSPVFVINAAFGLVLFILGCIVMSIKFDMFMGFFASGEIKITKDAALPYIPVILFGLITFGSLLSSITSSMISLEGKSFNILKSLPIEPYKIIFSKVLTSLIIILPFILIGDIIVFVRFKFNIIQIVLILISSIILPLVAESLGILVNLNHPKMDAENDTEVVKQSMSSTIAVLIGMVLVFITAFALIILINFVGINQTLLLVLGFYSLLCLLLIVYLIKTSVKKFNKIIV